MGGMSDLTVLMLTLNKLPKKWNDYYREVLTEAICDSHLITISKYPMDWGVNLIQEEQEGEKEGVINIYRQVLRGAKFADTPYIAIAEDDTLYPKEHFAFRPKPGYVAYNMTRWAMFTWRTFRRPIYFYRKRPSNSTMLCDRELVIETLGKYYDDDFNFIGTIEPEEIGFKDRSINYEEFYSYEPVVNLNHDYSIDHLETTHRKCPWPVQAYELPKWGHAEDVLSRFK